MPRYEARQHPSGVFSGLWGIYDAEQDDFVDGYEAVESRAVAAAHAYQYNLGHASPPAAPLDLPCFDLTAREIATLQAALRLWETTMNRDELDEELAIAGAAEGGALSQEEIRHLCAKLGVYRPGIEPFFEDDA